MQVGTLSSSHPSFGVSVFFLSFFLTPNLKIPVWWRRAVLPSLPWVICSFFLLHTVRGVVWSPHTDPVLAGEPHSAPRHSPRCKARAPSPASASPSHKCATARRPGASNRAGVVGHGDERDSLALLLFESFGGFGKGVREILRKAADVLQNKLTRAQYLDEVTWTTKSWLGLQKQRISVVLHTAIAEQVVNELACGGGGRVHGAKCLATLAGVA